VLALHYAITHPNCRVLVVSAGEEAARRLLAEIRRLALGSELLRTSVVDEMAALVTLSNGAEIRSTPASERAIRGWSVDLLLLDEAALILTELIEGAALPTTAARPHAKVVMASSATVASGSFSDHVVRAEAGSEHVRAHRWALADAEWISPSVISAACESMTEARFRAEYLGEFSSGADEESSSRRSPVHLGGGGRGWGSAENVSSASRCAPSARWRGNWDAYSALRLGSRGPEPFPP
jgi:hypothetical protein